MARNESMNDAHNVELTASALSKCDFGEKGVADVLSGETQQIVRTPELLQANNAELGPEVGEKQTEARTERESRTKAISQLAAAHSGPASGQLILSTLLSLAVVLALMLSVRVMVPPLVESIRYSWSHGQLRAEYEMSGQRLNNVSLKSLTEVSKLVSQRTGPSVVHINLKADAESNATAESEIITRPLPPPFDLLGQGSGFIIDTAGHVITNHHVINGVGRFEISLSDGRIVEARLVQFDALTDLAVLKIEADGLMPITWGDSDEVEVGSPVWAVGSPYGLDQSVTFGILSGKHRVNLKGTRYESKLLGDTPAYGDLMQSDVAVNPGNSGGPLVNALGEVVGVNTAIVGEHYRGISFSIPSNVARQVAENLIRDGQVVRGYLGVRLSDATEEDAEGAGQTKLRGAVVEGFPSDPNSTSPAKAAGILPGDIITKFDEKKVSNSGELMILVAHASVNSVAKIELLRGSKFLTVEVKIGRRP